MIEGDEERATLAWAGRKAFAGFALRTLEVTASTQDVVRAAARSGAEAGFCCIADSQTSGRGRQQRAWTAPAGTSLLTSVLVRVDHQRLGLVSIAAGLALRAAIESASGWSAAVKWPNDLLSRHRKLAGILCEVEPAAPEGPGAAVVVGAGVNLRVPSFPAGVLGISLHELVPSPPSSAALLAEFLTALAGRLGVLSDTGMEPLRAEWMHHASGIGDTVTATSAGGRVTGVAQGLDDDGALLVRTPSGVLRVLAGDVHLGLGDAPPR